MPDHVPSLQELIRRRQAGGFVGRREQLSAFESNLGLAVDDPRRRFVFCLHGSAGVGKTFLMRQFVRAARERQVVTASVDEAVHDVVTALEALVADLAAQGGRCREFPGLLEEYRQRRHELETDPATPEEVSSALTRSVVRVGLRMAGDLPVVGVAAEEVDADAVARRLDSVRAFLGRKFRNQEDIRMILSPVEVLTAAFLRDLTAISASRPLALFFDTYERTGVFLDAWLLDLLAGRHGPVPGNLVVTVAGQRPLDPNRWGDYLPVRADFALEPFTDDEARQLLAGYGVTDPQVVAIILELSGRLPVWVATLGSAQPDGVDAVDDPSGSAVDRFLKWEHAADRRAAALHGALPRELSRDLFTLLDTGDPGEDRFDWLRRLPFVVEQVNGYRYHDVVRAAMLRVVRRDSAADWKRHHQTLAAHHRAAKESLGLDGRAALKDRTWQEFALEEHYHELCARGAAALPAALGALVDAAAWRTSLTNSWKQMLQQAGKDSAVHEIARKADTFPEGDDTLVELLTSLISDPHLDRDHRATALTQRGITHRSAQQLDLALKDLDAALRIRPDDSWTLEARGRTLLLLKRYEDALADYNRALEVDPAADSIYAHRGRAYDRLKRFDEALADYDRAIELDPDYEWAIASRGLTFWSLERYDEALADFTRTIELNPEDGSNYATRAWTLQLMERYDEALTDYEKAIQLDPEDDWTLTTRGLTLQTLKRYDEAIADFTRALRLRPESAWIHRCRGDALQLVKRYDEALTDLDKAIELDPEDAWAVTLRGFVHQRLGRHEDALADLDRAIRLDPKNKRAWTNRGLIFQGLKRYDEALADFDRAIELDPDHLWAIINRGFTFRLMGQYEKALTEFDRTVELDPEDHWHTINRGIILRSLKRYDEALADFDRALQLSPDSGLALANRGETFRLMSRNEEALADFDRAVELAPEDSWNLGSRGQTLAGLGRYEQALRDFGRALRSDPDSDWILTSRGKALRLLQRYDEARADLEKVITLDPEDSWARYQLALVLRSTGHPAEAHNQLQRAIEAEEQNEDPNAFEIAVYFTALGNRDEALERLRQALRSNPAPWAIREAVDDLRDLRTVTDQDIGELVAILSH